MLGNDQSWSSLPKFLYVSDFGCGFINQFLGTGFLDQKKNFGLKIKK
jgi:hypothetical protein